jgi:FlaA1/EpsC-like NDP-sugar epimerase
VWRRAVLVGTPDTVAALAVQWSLREGGPVPCGCVLTERTALTHVVDVPILGTVEELEALHRREGFTVGVVSYPESRASEALRVRSVLGALGIAERVVPSLDDVLEGGAGRMGGGGARRELDLVELTGRPPRAIDGEAVGRVLGGKRVLITGAGGSIGSELARIAAAYGPSQLILMERAENALFEIDRRIGKDRPTVARRAVLHDVVDAEQTLRLFVSLKPEVVFHAAAHKHVPLMEDHPGHAVTNNVFGTKSVADAAMAVGAERFVMISSDKAVNPTSVMGGTKRLAEMYVQHLHQRSAGGGGGTGGKTRFSMVRFGNVLGSACSVLPIWSAQVAEGGPVTVTDARMTRYFMTIQEAAQLVIQSAAIDSGSSACVFVLDMGEPLGILALAERFVRMQGFVPRVVGAGRVEGAAGMEATGGRADGGAVMDIVLTGARPGEKLHEELAYSAEALRATPFEGIRAWEGRLPEGFDAATLIAEMSLARTNPDKVAVVAAIRRHVPEMTG